MSDSEPAAPVQAEGIGAPGSPDPGSRPRQRRLVSVAMRYRLLRRALGVQVIYRSNSGGLVVGGLSYAALFALIPTIVLVIAGVFLLVDDPGLRQEAVDMIDRAFPAFSGVADAALQQARELAAVGGIAALVGFAWGASGLYLNLTRAMERFFPGERVSGALARIVGVLLVLVVIIGVLAAVVMAGVLTVIARSLQLDVEWLLTAASVLVTLVLATTIVYGVYRVIPSNPPDAQSARLPAIVVGIAVASMTWLYSLLSPWLVTGFQVFGVAASTFVALVWLRFTFLAMVYGAAMARYRDFVQAAGLLGEAQPDTFATQHALAEEARRNVQELEDIRRVERQRAASRTTAADDAGRADTTGADDATTASPDDTSDGSV